MLRLRRDVLRRSTIGAMLSNRSISTVAPGSANQMWGLDGNFAFRQNVFMSGYIAQTRTDRPPREGLQLSRSVQLRRRSLRRTGRAACGGGQLQSRGRFPQAVGFQEQLCRLPVQPAAQGTRGRPPVSLRKQPRVRHGHAEPAGVARGAQQLPDDLQNGDQFGATYTRSLESTRQPLRDLDRRAGSRRAAIRSTTCARATVPDPSTGYRAPSRLTWASSTTGTRSTAAARGRFEADVRASHSSQTSR